MTKTTSLVSRGTVLMGAMALATGIVAPAHASAAEMDESEVLFAVFVDDLRVPTDTARALHIEFEKMDAAERHGLLLAIAQDPASVIDFEETSQTNVLPAVGADGMLRAAVKTYLASNTASATLLGIPVASFTAESKYEASATAVTRILTCNGWYSGIGVTSSVSASSFISSSGRGNCEVLHRASVVFDGSPITFNKKHTIVTKSGTPSTFVATLSTV